MCQPPYPEGGATTAAALRGIAESAFIAVDAKLRVHSLAAGMPPRPLSEVGLACHSRVSDWLHGLYWLFVDLSSITW
jgi:hypothetical protein